MTNHASDALVFFGATGDLAYKKIFPSLQAMVKRGHLNVPVIGVAKSGWNLKQLQARVRDSLEKHGGVDSAAFEKLISLLRYVDGDYSDNATFQAIRSELKDSKRPAHYLAIPPLLFGTVVEQLGRLGSVEAARVIVEKPSEMTLLPHGVSTASCVEHSRNPIFFVLTIILASRRSTTSYFSGSLTP